MKSQIKMRSNKVAVEKIKKQAKKAEAFYVTPESDEFLGTVRFVGATSTDVNIGDKVYFGNQYQLVKMLGAEMCIMNDDNILATVVDEQEVNPQS